MAKFVRVRNKKLGREYTTALVTEDMQVLDKEPALDRNGRPLPGKPIQTPSAAKKSAAKKAPAAKPAATKTTSSKADKEATDND